MGIFRVMEQNENETKNQIRVSDSRNKRRHATKTAVKD